jgi:ubiquinone/menaquinone biosynthesis C-methylase UbiE
MSNDWWSAFAGAGGLEELETWLGGVDAASRVRIRERIAQCGYESVLDCGAGIGIDYIGLQSNMAHPVSYQGIEPSHALRKAAKAANIAYGHDGDPPITDGLIENIPFPDSSFDLVYARHIFEHLPRFEDALTEMIRVASLEVIVVFFMKPGKETFLLRERDGLWHNRWAKSDLDAVLNSNPKVEVSFYESLDSEILLHVYLADARQVNGEQVAERLRK